METVARKSRVRATQHLQVVVILLYSYDVISVFRCWKKAPMWLTNRSNWPEFTIADAAQEQEWHCFQKKRTSFLISYQPCEYNH